MGIGFVADFSLTIPAAHRAAFEEAWLADDARLPRWPTEAWADLLANRLDTNVSSALRALRRAGALRTSSRGRQVTWTWRALLSEDDASLAGTATSLLRLGARFDGEGRLCVASDGTAPVDGWAWSLLDGEVRTDLLTARQAHAVRGEHAHARSTRARSR